MTSNGNETAVELVVALLEEQPLMPSPSNPSKTKCPSYFDYGTAGFRFKAEIMDGLMVRVGVLSILLMLQKQDLDSISTADSNTITNIDMGIMITASHNDESYNGIKLANPDGSMLTPSQETFLTEWVNETVIDKWKTMLKESIITSTSMKSIKRTIHVGCDTRSHSPHLSNLFQQGAKRMIDALQQGGVIAIHDHGVLTTPMLHHIVLHSNANKYLPLYIQPKPSREGYIQTFATAYVDLIQLLNKNVNNDSDEAGNEQSNNTVFRLHIDGACGVGCHAVEELSQAIQDLLEERKVLSTTPMTLFMAHNGAGDGPLNTNCGSEHVQKQLQPPTWYDGIPSEGLDYCCSLDGDADRIVFFGQTDPAKTSIDSESNTSTKLTNLLDGDKIAILIAHVLKNKLSSVQGTDGHQTSIRMGIVQTAYANGSATEYVQSKLRLPVIIAKTGVKHLHHAAVKHFDIGIYFEANGHGTVVFSKNYEKFALERHQEHNDPFFVCLHQLINPAVGDALCDMLLVDFLLKSLGGWTLTRWNEMYHDLPSRMLKVKVANRSLIRCNENESECIEPSLVQSLLQQVVNETSHGRTFIRPSGTEDVVRVYAEAATREDADTLAIKAAHIVYDTCQGVGDRPIRTL